MAQPQPASENGPRALRPPIEPRRTTSFVENQGQAPADVLWQAKGSGFEAAFARDSFVLRIAGRKAKSDRAAGGKAAAARAVTGQPAAADGGQTTVTEQRISFRGANPRVRLEAEEPQPGKMNFFRGNDPKHWASGLPTYARLRYKDIYPGIDLLFYSRQGSLEYDFVAAPGSDPSAIRLRVEEGGPMRLTARGELQVGDGASAVLHHPLLYQNRDRGKKVIEGQFVQLADRAVGLEFGSYDKSRTLVIDPR